MNRVVFALIVAAAFLCSGCSEAIAARSERTQVQVSVTPSGLVQVVVETHVAFLGGPSDHFRWDVSSGWADGFTFRSASMDGREMQAGATGAERVEVDDGAALGVRWMFPEADGHVFRLAYDVTGAVAVDGSRGTIVLPLIVPAYAHGSTVIDLRIPAEAAFRGDTGIAERGWQVEVQPEGVTARRPMLRQDEGATLMASFTVIPSQLAEPEWQRHQILGQQLIPAFVSGGAFILVIGVGTLWIVRFQYGTGLRRRQLPASEIARLEAERPGVRAAMRTAGVVCVVLAAVTAGLVHALLGHFGTWPQAIPVSIGVVGISLILFRRVAGSSPQ